MNGGMIGLSGYLTRAGIGLMAILLTMGCSGGGDVGEPPDDIAQTEALALQARSDTRLAGTLLKGGVRVEFEAMKGSGSLATSTLILGGKTFEHALDASTGTLTVDGHDNVLSAGDIALVRALAVEMERRLAPSVSTGLPTQEVLLLGQLTWLADTHADFTVSRFTRKNPLLQTADGPLVFGVGNNGVLCLARGARYAVSFWPVGWNWAVSEYAYANASYGIGTGAGPDYPYGDWTCQGQCGTGCQDWWHSGLFYDCLEHDRCTYHYSTHKCDPAAVDAADDYTASFTSICR